MALCFFLAEIDFCDPGIDGRLPWYAFEYLLTVI
jgi:hypothetical protein